MKLIVGLGNPGKKYEGTRHNVGWDTVSLLAKKLEASTFQSQEKFKSELAETIVDGEKILFVHPLTYMNASGEAVHALMSFYKVDLQDVLIVHDEMDFSPGIFAFSIGAGPAGNNGVASIQETLGTKNIARLRIGIGRSSPPMANQDYVLSKPTLEERLAIDSSMEKCAQAAQQWITEGLTKSMNSWNGVKSASS
ncbi:aminoacyl-tRNA hydrolase [Candidatus Uhrbacteria bacterium]|nr:aminoacyl-tRNA hydrolase [Candidatus Uhrbacteria bacterium]